MIPLVCIKFAGGVIGRIKVRMHDTACRNVNAGRIVVIGLNSQLPAVGRIDPVIIVPILSIVRGCPDPTGQSEVIQFDGSAYRAGGEPPILVLGEVVGASRNGHGSLLGGIGGIVHLGMISMRAGIRGGGSHCLIQVVDSCVV